MSSHYRYLVNLDVTSESHTTSVALFGEIADAYIGCTVNEYKDTFDRVQNKLLLYNNDKINALYNLHTNNITFQDQTNSQWYKALSATITREYKVQFKLQKEKFTYNKLCTVAEAIQEIHVNTPVPQGEKVPEEALSKKEPSNIKEGQGPIREANNVNDPQIEKKLEELNDENGLTPNTPTNKRGRPMKNPATKKKETRAKKKLANAEDIAKEVNPNTSTKKKQNPKKHNTTTQLLSSDEDDEAPLASVLK